MATRPQDELILQQMAELARGRDPYGQHVDRDTQLLALDRYMQLRGQIAATELDEQKRAAEVQMQAERIKAEAEAQAKLIRAQAEAEALKYQATVEARAQDREMETRRLELEAERISLQKAEVLVRAIEAVSKVGRDAAAQLVPYVQDLGTKLIGAPVPLAIEAVADVVDPSKLKNDGNS